MSNVLVIGDTHIPFVHKDYLSFCKKVYRDYNCKTIVHIGDVCDNHAISYHEHDPDGYSPGEEMQEALTILHKWYKTFEHVIVCIGNHDALPFRKAFTHGLSKDVMKTYEEIWQCPKGWLWTPDYEINNVKYTHGTGGKYNYANMATNERQSIVCGHTHSNGGVTYLASNNSLIFGLNAGCGIDPKAYSMEYGKDFPRRPTLGCGVVLENGRTAQFLPMKMN